MVLLFLAIYCHSVSRVEWESILLRADGLYGVVIVLGFGLSDEFGLFITHKMID